MRGKARRTRIQIFEVTHDLKKAQKVRMGRNEEATPQLAAPADGTEAPLRAMFACHS